MVTTVTEVLNIWNQMGVFSYVIPFLLIFAVVFAILKKTQILGDEKPILAIISAALGLLSLQFDFVSEFYAIVFPRFGIGLSLFLVFLIFVGFFMKEDGTDMFKKMGWMGYVIGIGVMIWALGSWDAWNDYSGFGGWFSDNFWAVLILGLVVGVIVVVSSSGDESSGAKPRK